MTSTAGYRPASRASSSTPSSKGTGLFFPIDPGANATIGGMAATRASGTNAVRYGTMRENVLGLTVVTADGKLIRTGGRARKSSAGYDLTRLFVGAEGTLGRDHRDPAARCMACRRQSPRASASSLTSQARSRPSSPRCRPAFRWRASSCSTMCRWTRRFATPSSRDLPSSPRCSSNFTAPRPGVREQSEAMQAISDEFGGSAFQWATQAEDRTRLWKARHAAYYAAMAYRPGHDVICHRCLRAHFAAGGLHHGDESRTSRRAG